MPEMDRVISTSSIKFPTGSVILSTGVTGGGLAYRLKSGAANQQPSAVE